MPDVALAGPVVGRFAPSPSGPLHFGSMVAALGSCLSARAAGGRWLLRIEDVDTPRTVPGAAEGILRTLEQFGFEWDGPVVWQSRRTDAYRAAFEALRAAERVFPCACTRREIADSALARDGTRRYPGTCRDGLAPGREARAWRLRVEPGVVSFDDAVQGLIREDVAADVGDFVLLRADGLFAYQLAVVVDDAEAGVTEVVRGADLLDSAPRQAWLATRLGFEVPSYAHVGLAVNQDGDRLAKRDGAVTLATLSLRGVGTAEVCRRLCASAGLPEADSAAGLLRAVAGTPWSRTPAIWEPWVVRPDQ